MTLLWLFIACASIDLLSVWTAIMLLSSLLGDKGKGKGCQFV